MGLLSKRACAPARVDDRGSAAGDPRGVCGGAAGGGDGRRRRWRGRERAWVADGAERSPGGGRGAEPFGAGSLAACRAHGSGAPDGRRAHDGGRMRTGGGLPRGGLATNRVASTTVPTGLQTLPAQPWLDAAGWRRLERRLKAARSRPRRVDAPLIVSVTARLGDVDPSSVVAASRRPSESWFCFEQPDRDRTAVAALGQVLSIEAEGEDRFARTAERWRAIARDALADEADGPRSEER